MDERLIQTFYYTLGGFLLGIVIAIQWSYAIDTHTNSILIIMITMLCSAILGFLFPKSIAHIFKVFWNFFK
ncbi:hypothetical protein [Acinetobacter kyonggiensis]|uniref:Uncharacterized protein n=1 Tax=Acinetobacter kyonggiensis TaxID=595670 RepID=A0A1H3IWS7_9GAMM|nr:hypothetical protein [Acinetobacter kyonggiensis]SDY32170.1 hypothetical protein SAMN05421643_107141 [Acinetobacter kyonggiensis]